MLGHAEEWFYRYLAGIDFDLSRPPGERIVLRPTPVGDIESAHARYETRFGPVSISWRRRGGRFFCDVEVPPKTTAWLLLPGKPGRQVQAGPPPFRARDILSRSAPAIMTVRRILPVHGCRWPVSPLRANSPTGRLTGMSHTPPSDVARALAPAVSRPISARVRGCDNAS